MKYQNKIVIDLPRQQVVDLFQDPENMKHWQPGFISIKHLSGTEGEVGSKSELEYKMGRRTIIMTETVTVKDLPNEFSAIYETKGVWNEVRNHFSDTDDDKTLYLSDCEFRFKGFMKIMAFLMPSAFKKQSLTYMQDFKAFAESSKN